MRQVYDGRELRTKTDLLLMSSGFPIDFDVSHGLVAFVYTEINEDSVVESMLKTVEASSLGQNIYLKEMATRLVHLGHSSLETIGNLLSVNKASTIADRTSAASLDPSQSSASRGKEDFLKQGNQFACHCRAKKHARKNGGLNVTDSMSAVSESHLSVTSAQQQQQQP